MLDIAIWDGLLRRHVDDRGRVDYATWQRQGAAELEHWLAAQRPFDPEPGSRPEAMALWINLYNALVIRQVLARFPLASIRPTIAGVPNWPAFLAFFSRPVISLQGQSLSLNRIEHGILRPRFGDPRLHFALVCAAVGCPLLRPEAYRPSGSRPSWRRTPCASCRIRTSCASIRPGAACPSAGSSSGTGATFWRWRPRSPPMWAATARNWRCRLASGSATSPTTGPSMAEVQSRSSP